MEKLEAWQKARILVKILVKEVSILVANFPITERFGLSGQLGRAIISVPSNISEGCGRPSIKERIHFFEIAYSSLMESMNQLMLANDLGFISNKDLEKIRIKTVGLAKIINGLRKSLLSRLNNPNK